MRTNITNLQSDTKCVCNLCSAHVWLQCLKYLCCEKIDESTSITPGKELWNLWICPFSSKPIGTLFDPLCLNRSGEAQTQLSVNKSYDDTSIHKSEDCTLASEVRKVDQVVWSLWDGSGTGGNIDCVANWRWKGSSKTRSENAIAPVFAYGCNPYNTLLFEEKTPAGHHKQQSSTVIGIAASHSLYTQNGLITQLAVDCQSEGTGIQNGSQLSPTWYLRWNLTSPAEGWERPWAQREDAFWQINDGTSALAFKALHIIHESGVLDM